MNTLIVMGLGLLILFVGALFVRRLLQVHNPYRNPYSNM